MNKKLFFSIISVVVISAVTVGVTYAYYEASNSAALAGTAQGGINTTLNLTSTYVATDLVPLSDSLVKGAISKSSNKCIDKKNYQVCSLYKITLNNTSASENLYGYIRTGTSTYITDNLKYQVFDSSYNALTDVMTLSKNTDDTVYFKKNNSQYTTISNGSVIYYLAVWLTDTGGLQNDDYSKSFDGFVGFESVGQTSGKIEADFSV